MLWLVIHAVTSELILHYLFTLIMALDTILDSNAEATEVK